MRRRGVVQVLGALVLLVALALAVPAEGQQQSKLWIRSVDQQRAADAAPEDKTATELVFVSTGDPGQALAAKATEKVDNTTTDAAGAPVVLPDDRTRAVAIVIDAAKANDDTGFLAASRDAAKKIVADSPGVRFSIIAANDKPAIVVRFTSDRVALEKGIDSIGPSELGAGTWQAFRLAGEALKEEDAQPNVMGFIGSNDAIAPQNEPLGSSAVITSGASTFLVLNSTTGFDPSPYQKMVNRSGGVVTGADANGTQTAADTMIDTIRNKQYLVRFESTAQNNQLTTYAVEAGDLSSRAQVLCCTAVAGVERLTPAVESSGGGLPFLEGTLGLIIVLLVVLVAGAALAYGIASIFIQDRTLSSVLQPYAEAYSDDDDEGGSALARSAIIQRGVSVVEQVARDQGMQARTEASLERANLPLRAGEALFFYLAIVVVVTLIGLLLLGNFIAGLILGAIAAILPVAIINFLAGRRRKQFMSQLPDTLSLLSGTLRAGYSLMQGVEAVSQEVDDPMGLELRRVVTEARLGRPLEEALDSSAERMDSPDFGWAVMAIRIQREVGGNLSELLMTVADTMIARERLRRDVAALTAEGRVSAIVLGALPVGLGFMMYLLNKEYVSVLFTDTLGNIMLGLAVVAMIVGFLWMRKIINIEI